MSQKNELSANGVWAKVPFIFSVELYRNLKSSVEQQIESNICWDTVTEIVGLTDKEIIFCRL